MTDSSLESGSGIADMVAICQQTRFDVPEDKRSTVVRRPILPRPLVNPAPPQQIPTTSWSMLGSLWLKGGVHYGLLARIGSAKSSAPSLPRLSSDCRSSLLRSDATRNKVKAKLDEAAIVFRGLEEHGLTERREGLSGRKELIAFEKQIDEARKRVDNIEEPVASKECQDEIAQAARLLAELQPELQEPNPCFLPPALLYSMADCQPASQPRFPA
ncbi:hypothetical protein F5B21DRAFT_510170 [Xylaria acuta]|nr:hypothetical protein F5B21DRAFT_510170 [Xylaria acuta]